MSVYKSKSYDLRNTGFLYHDNFHHFSMGGSGFGRVELMPGRVCFVVKLTRFRLNHTPSKYYTIKKKIVDKIRNESNLYKKY